MAADMRGDGTVFRQKGSRFWWISYWRQGKRRRESSGSEEFKVARELLNLRRAGTIVRADEVVASTPETVTIAELVADLLSWYLTENPRLIFHKDTLSRWDLHLKSFFATTKASELGSSHLRAYRVKRSAEKAAFATINRELQILRKAYKLAAESEPPKVLRVPKFKGAIGRERNARKVFIEPAMADKLKETAAKEGLWARAFLDIAFTFGWRKGEIQKLKVGNVWLSENTIRIEDSKNGEAREISMPESLRVLVQPLVIGRNRDEALWPVQSFRYAWKRICKAAGVKTGKLEGFVMHDIRRTSARSKRASGVSESVIMDIHGWKTAEMFRRYGIVNQSDRVQALLKETEFLAEAQKKALQAEQNALVAELTYMSPPKTGNA